MAQKFIEIEKKWQKYWRENEAMYAAKDGTGKPKKYVLVEFPYPSGSGLHIGHAFAFTGGDVYARFKRMSGYEVLFPMGWDAFGLPTENYAIKNKRKPQEVTLENTDNFREEMRRLAFSFDWSREVNTTDPKYYKWTQWIFIQLFKNGLAYKEEMPINWCPSCKIGLANEEVVDGKCERCGAEVERRTISQWVVRITKYADRLLSGLEKTEFIDKVKAAQVNWIGKSEGAKIRFKIKDRQETLEVFTTRPDTLYGATFMVISPEHQIALELGKNNQEIKEYQIIARSKSEMERTELSKEKTGVFSGLWAVNPVNNKEIPIWVSDFVMASYGTGAIMAVPAHDQRDFDFAKKFGLEIIPVIESEENKNNNQIPYTKVDEGKMINSPKWDGLKPSEAIKVAIEWSRESGIGEATTSYHLRDWIFSRQHYWGEPIPMVNCKEHGWVSVPESELPVRLPEVEAYEPTDDGKSPLAKMTEFVNTVCPVCGGDAKRETDTMPNWAGSDWYFMRYCDPHNDMVLGSQEKLKYWMPVDVYIGGDEHNTLHLLYSRFIYQFLWDVGVVPKEQPEPYFKRISHGVILGPDGARMSKSRGNVVVPGDVADIYGSDVLRMYLMFMGPYTATIAWNEKTVAGVKRFLEKINSLAMSVAKENELTEEAVNSQRKVMARAIEGITHDLDDFGFNTAIAKLMEAVNQLRGQRINLEVFKTLVILLAPMAPYTAEELWSQIRTEDDTKSVHLARWPIVEKETVDDDEIISIPVAIDGRVRGQLELRLKELGRESEVLVLAKQLETIKKWIEGKKVVREVYVKGKMVNLVTV
ncbi:MAG: leucine--tRNA ligase [Candidatus Shapirobacteria bacterium]